MKSDSRAGTAAMRREQLDHGAIDAPINRAATFLAMQQDGAGLWRDFSLFFPLDQRSSISTDWCTAFVGCALLAANLGLPEVDSALRALINSQRETRDWGFAPESPPDADSTANVMLLLNAARDRGIGGLDGSLPETQLMRYWVPNKHGFRTFLPRSPRYNEFLLAEGLSWCDVHPCVTSVAVRAAHLFGLSPAEVSLGVESVGAMQTSEGAWNAFWWEGRTYSTYQAALLMNDFGQRERVARACAWAGATQQSDGGWSDERGSESSTFQSAFGLLILLLDERPNWEAIDASLHYLSSRQLIGGNWPVSTVLRMPKPGVSTPWLERDDCLLIPPVADRNSLFSTAAGLLALATLRNRLGVWAGAIEGR